MQAIQIKAPGIFDLKEIDKPRPLPGEVLIQVRYVGFCGSDLSTWLGKNPMVSYPRIPGHEISGNIVEKGAEVPSGLEKGDPVTVVPYTSCGSCSSCRAGRFNACRNNQTLGVQRDGGMQEFVAVPWEKVLRAPGLDHLELVMVEPLTVGFHAIERGKVQKDDVVLVLGCGMIGSGAIVAALGRGARVIAADVDDHKLKLAGRLGAQHLVNVRRSELHDELMKITDREGPTVAVEAAGQAHTYRVAVEEVAFAGRVVCIGYAGADVSLPTKFFVQKEMDILGSRNATAEDFKDVIRYLETGSFPLQAMITRILKPERAGEALEAWASDPGKVMKMMIEFHTENLS